MLLNSPLPSANDAEFNNDWGLSKIDTLEVPEHWKQRFIAICHAGGPKLPNLKSLPKPERQLAHRLNILACAFGPFYYFSKGMWKKGVGLSALMLPFILILGWVLSQFGVDYVYSTLFSGSCALFGIRANIDYYKEMVLEDKGWW
jgi:hypothetical protein